MTVTWFQDDGPKRAWPFWLIVCLYGLIGMTDLIKLFALPWMIGRSDVVSFWVVWGYVLPIGGTVLVLAAAGASIAYDHFEKPIGRRVPLLIFAIFAIACLDVAARARVESRTDDLRVTWEDWRRADVIYRVEHASYMVVSCDTGRKRKIYPSIEVTFFDGEYLDITSLVLPRSNRAGRRDGLVLAERFDSFLSARGNRYLSRYRSLDSRCVDRTARKLGDRDAWRVARLFRF